MPSYGLRSIRLAVLPLSAVGIQSLHHALVNDNIPASSSICSNVGGSPMTISMDFSQLAPGKFSPTNSKYEKDVFLVQMEMGDTSAGTDPEAYRIRVAKGGNIYSFTNGYGMELMAPQGWVDAPFNDEVWQFVSVDADKHNPDGGDNMMIHQSGAYLRTTAEPELTSPWVSPDLAPSNAISCSGHTCAFVSWSQQSDLPTPFSSSVLSFQRYTHCEDGVLEHTSVIHNMEYNPDPATEEFNDDEYTFLSTPWTGIRTSVLPDIVESAKNGTLSLSGHMPPWNDHTNTKLEDTAGFLTFAEEIRTLNPLYPVPCGSATNNDTANPFGTELPCSHPDAEPISYELEALWGNTACNVATWAPSQFGVKGFFCRIKPTALVGKSSYSPGNPTLLQLVTDDPSVADDSNAQTLDDAFIALDLHPFRGILNFSWYNPNNKMYFFLFSPKDQSITAAQVNAILSPGVKFNITQTPQVSLPCSSASGNAIDCAAPGASPPLQLKLRAIAPGQTVSCNENTYLSALYAHTVVQCCLDTNIAVKGVLNTKYTDYTLVSSSSGEILHLNIHGVLHWSWPNTSGGSTRYFFIFFPEKGVTASSVNSMFAVGDTLKLYENVGGKPWHQAYGLTQVVGTSTTLNEVVGGGNTGVPARQQSTYRFGKAGSPARDFLAMEVSSFLNVKVGETLSKRQYMITGKLSEAKNKGLKWVQETDMVQINAGASFSTGHVVELFANMVDSSGSFGGALSTDGCGAVNATRCVGSTVPKANHYATFAIECGDSFYVGTDLYYFALELPPEMDDGCYRPYICNDSAGGKPKYTFLGFFESNACSDLQGLAYNETLC